MKKFFSVFLSVILVLAMLAPAAFAVDSGDGCDCGVLPQVYVGPLGNTSIYKNINTADEKQIFRLTEETTAELVLRLAPALAELAVTFDTDAFADKLIKVIDETMGDLALDGNGDSLPGVGVKIEMPTHTTHTQGENYYFHYDWRLDPVEVAAQLNDFVQYVKELTGHDKVHMRSSSMGGVIMMSYFEQYGYDDVVSAIFVCSPILGTSFAGDLLAGKFVLDADVIYNYGCDAYPPVDPEGVLLTMLFDLLKHSGILDGVLFLGNALVDEIIDRVYAELLTPVFGTLLGLWAFVPDETYEVAKKMNLDPETQAGLIAKADYYHYNVQGKADEILNGALENGIRVMIVVGHGITHTPLMESAKYADSDCTVDTRYASAGATVADIGTTFEDGYKQKVYDGHNHVSPLGNIDASTCILPENTWFIKGMLHSNNHDGTNAMYDWFMYSEESYNVWSNDAYPQFMDNDKVNQVLIPLGNFAADNEIVGDGVIEIPDTGSKPVTAVAVLALAGVAALTASRKKRDE